MSERKAGRIAAFLGIWLMEGAVALGLLVLLAYVSFRMRFSTEVIRAGIIAIYAVPCFLGGCLVRSFRLHPALLWGVGAGAAFYGGLLLLSAREIPESMLSPELLLLCAASAAAGVFSGKKCRTDKKSDRNK